MLAALLALEAADAITTPVVDACTLNNAMNAAQIALLVALVRWSSRERE